LAGTIVGVLVFITFSLALVQFCRGHDVNYNDKMDIDGGATGIHDSSDTSESRGGEDLTDILQVREYFSFQRLSFLNE
jgi:hypothetical protein